MKLLLKAEDSTVTLEGRPEDIAVPLVLLKMLGYKVSPTVTNIVLPRQKRYIQLLNSNPYSFPVSPCMLYYKDSIVYVTIQGVVRTKISKRTLDLIHNYLKQKDFIELNKMFHASTINILVKYFKVMNRLSKIIKKLGGGK